jgi:hypothetical protein
MRLRAPRAITAATVEGPAHPRPPRCDGELELPYVGLPRESITLVVGLRRPTRPADTMPAPLSFRADPTVVVGRAELRF